MSPLELQKKVISFLLWIVLAVCMFKYGFSFIRSERPETTAQILRKLSIRGGILAALSCVAGSFLIMVASLEDPFNFVTFRDLSLLIWPYVVMVGLGGLIALYTRPKFLSCFSNAEAWIWRWLYKHCRPHRTEDGDEE